MISCKGKIIKHPNDLVEQNLTEHFLRFSGIDVDYFLVPNYLRDLELGSFSAHQKCLIYKIGFLTEYLRILYPDRSKDFIYQIVNYKHQVFVSKRNFTQYLTHWNKHRNQILNVSNVNR